MYFRCFLSSQAMTYCDSMNLNAKNQRLAGKKEISFSYSSMSKEGCMTAKKVQSVAETVL